MGSIRLATPAHPSEARPAIRQLGRYLPLVQRLARFYHRRSGAELDDLVQVGCIGLLRALQRYDASLGFSFEAYASRMITGEIAHFLRDLMYLVRPPRDLVELRPAIRAAIARLTQAQQQDPSALDIARVVGLSPDKVKEVLALDHQMKPLSLDAELPGMPERAFDLPAPQAPPGYLEERIVLQESMERLGRPYREIIELYFFQDLSQQETSRRLGISPAQVSRRLRVALKELRRLVAGKESSHVR